MNFPSSEPQDLLTEHLLAHPHALGFVGVGIGKTAATLAAFAKLLRAGEAVGALVLAPVRVTNLTWPLEVQRWDDFKWMRVANLRQESGKRAFLQGTAHIYVCNYESIPMLLRLVEARKKTGKGLPYDTLIVDECFAPGTLIDTPEGKKPIEQVRKGDCVFNAVGVGVVTHEHTTTPSRIARIVVEGREIWCSAGHLFFTADGWLPACQIKAGQTAITTQAQSMRLVRDYLHAERSQQREQNAVLREEMLHGSVRGEKETGESFETQGDEEMCLVSGFVCSLSRETLLRHELLREVEDAVNPQANLDRRSQSKVFTEFKSLLRKWVRFSKDAVREDSFFEANAERVSPNEAEFISQSNEAQTTCARWKRSPRIKRSTGAIRCVELLRTGHVENGVHFQDSRDTSPGTHPVSLQTRPWMRESETVNRGRWGDTSRAQDKTERQKKDGGAGFQRVDSVEVYESTDSRLDRFRSPDGVVRFYDLSVSGHPSYSVNGLLVHNCTKLKNPSAKRPNAYRRVVPHAEHKRIWGLTGTPAPNSLLDLFAQVRFVDGGQRLGRAFDLFKQTYFKPSGYQGYQWKELPGSKELIEQRIHDITLTLRSKDWLDIPDTVVEDIDIHLPTKLMADYKAFEKELVLQIRQGKEITAANAAALVSKLLQFTSGSLYDEERQWHTIHELKLDALAKLAKEVKSPLLVAYAFQHEAHRIRQRFPQAKFFGDAKNAAAQTQLLKDWNDKKIPMLVAHPKSVGHGLNLQHGGSTLVWMSLTYSREDYEQMIARLSRRGQDELVTVYRLMCMDTVDYAVATVIEEKRTTEDRLLAALQLLESCREVPLKNVRQSTEYMEGEWI